MTADQTEAEQKLNQLQIMEQGLQNILMQKQQFQSQVTEFDAALEEVKKAKQSFKIIGNIMVAASPEQLTDEMKRKKEVAELRVKTLEKQENSLREKSKKMQEEVMKIMEKK